MDSGHLPVVLASLLTFTIYHKLEPLRPVVHLLLLVVIPTCHPAFRSTSPFLVYWFLILLWVAAYRLSPLHPLAKYPGPALARLSNLWLAYHNLKGDTFRVVRALHARHGDVVRVGPNELSFARTDALQWIYLDKTLEKGPYFDTRDSPSGTPLDGIRNYAEHARRRKPWARAMGVAALKGYHPIVRDKIDELMEHLEAMAARGDAVNLSDWLNFFGFDFMGKMAFDHEFGMMKAGRDTSGFLELIENGVFVAGSLSHVPWLIPLLKLIPGANKPLDALLAFTTSTAHKRVHSASTDRDLFYYLVGEDLPADSTEKPSLAEASADATLAVIGGADTTATALCHLVYFLLRDPDCHARLREEIEEHFPQGEDVFDPTRHADMPYLNACINEALRLYPSILGSSQRRVEFGTGGADICGYFVPEGTQVFVHQFTLHRSPENFSPLPDAFWPDRWLAQETYYTLPGGERITADEVRTERAAFVPFAVGQQACAGKGLAVMEMRAMLCALVRGFEIDVADGFGIDSWEVNVRDYYVSAKGPLIVNIVTRPAAVVPAVVVA